METYNTRIDYCLTLSKLMVRAPLPNINIIKQKQI